MKEMLGRFAVGSISCILTLIVLNTMTDLSIGMCNAFALTNSLICGVGYSIWYKLEYKDED